MGDHGTTSPSRTPCVETPLHGHSRDSRAPGGHRQAAAQATASQGSTKPEPGHQDGPGSPAPRGGALRGGTDRATWMWRRHEEAHPRHGGVVPLPPTAIHDAGGEWILGRVDGKDPPRMCKVGHTYEIAHRGEGGEWDPAPTAAEEAGLQAVAAVWVDGEAGVQNFTLHGNLYLPGAMGVCQTSSDAVFFLGRHGQRFEAMYEAHCAQFHMFANEVLQALQSVVLFEVITDSFVLKVADLVL